MLREPGLRVGIGSHTQRYANKISKKIKAMVTRAGGELGTDQRSDEWCLTNGSTLIAKGVGGSIAGESIDLFMLDDVFGSRADAESQTVQERVYDWYMDDVTPRLQKDAALVFSNTRWGVGDLVGRIQQSEEWHEWLYVRLPAIAETQEQRDQVAAMHGMPIGEPDPLGRQPGEALCHASGTMIYDGKWMRVDDHPSFDEYRHGSGFEISVWGIPSSETVTPEHRYWAFSERRKLVVDGVIKRFGRNTPPGWIEAKDIDRACSIGLPIDYSISPVQGIPTLVCDKAGGNHRAPRINWREEILVPEEFKDPEWWWYFGLWWGDGSTWGGITVHLSDEETESRVIRLIERYGKKVRVTNNQGCRAISFENSNLERWLKSWRVDDCRKQPPEWIEKIDFHFQEQLVKGYLDSDGSFNDIGARIVSIHLPGLMCLRRILARLGIPSSIAKEKPAGEAVILGRKVKVQQCYRILFREGSERIGLSFKSCRSGRGRAKGSFIENGFLWSKVRDSVSVNDGKYCPITTESETYTTDFGLSHNCPDRYPLDKLLQKQRIEGVGFESVYQQNPVPRGGTYFQRKWLLGPDGKPALKSIDEIPLMLPMVNGRRLVRYWDLADSRADAACYTAGVLLCKIGDGEHAMYYVCDVVRGRWSPPERNEKMREVAEKDALIPGFEKTWFESPVFDKGKAAARGIYAVMSGHPVSADNVGGRGSKELRAEPVAGAAKGGIVKVIDGGWVPAFLNELESFPKGTYKDQIDSLSGAHFRLSRGGFAFSVG
jgi:predicted phage terminase large subunit-like protein